jgi:hypothetical protein
LKLPAMNLTINGSAVKLDDRQSTVNLDGDRATRESYTIAHHAFNEKGRLEIMVAWLL